MLLDSHVFVFRLADEVRKNRFSCSRELAETTHDGFCCQNLVSGSSRGHRLACSTIAIECLYLDHGRIHPSLHIHARRVLDLFPFHHQFALDHLPWLVEERQLQMLGHNVDQER